MLPLRPDRALVLQELEAPDQPVPRVARADDVIDEPARRGQPRDLEAVVRALEPTVLIGLSGAPGSFSEAVVRTMADHCAQPVLMPMSNPTTSLEAHPADIARWSDGGWRDGVT